MWFVFRLRRKTNHVSSLLRPLRSRKRRRCGSFFGQSPKNEPHLLLLRAKRAREPAV
ncbi:MAG: hypothetical protein U5L45_08565 [Saprospiraceae bacterium]|nr:hypothetical protein [Saprospiraceae bacterium]